MDENTENEELTRIITEALGGELRKNKKRFIMPLSFNGPKLQVGHDLIPQLLDLITKNKQTTDRNRFAFMLSLVAKREELDSNCTEWVLVETVDNPQDKEVWITFREWLGEAGFELPKVISLN